MVASKWGGLQHMSSNAYGEKRSQVTRSTDILTCSEYLAGSNPAKRNPSLVPTSVICPPEMGSLIASLSGTDNLTSESSIPSMAATISKGLRASMFFTDTRIDAELLHHLCSNARPAFSSEELMFLELVRTDGIRRAAYLAGVFEWTYRRPLCSLLTWIHTDLGYTISPLRGQQSNDSECSECSLDQQTHLT